jgi:hypothetical protein
LARKTDATKAVIAAESMRVARIDRLKRNVKTMDETKGKPKRIETRATAESR